MAGDNSSSTLLGRFGEMWENFLSERDRSEKKDNYDSREKIIAFTLAFLLALCFWLLVNLSRTFNVTVNIPIEAGRIPTGKALTESLPEFASVSVSGEGWSLISFYNNPPTINVDITKSQVNLFDQVREQMNAVPEVDVLKVQPVELSITLEDKITVKKRIDTKLEISFAKQFGLLDTLEFQPDSALVSGAASIVKPIDAVETESISLNNINEDINVSVPLKSPDSLVELNNNVVQITGNVVEYTEGELRVRVQIIEAPSDVKVNFSPSIVTIKYDVPIQEYSRSQDMIPYHAVVPYDHLMNDSTGYVQPKIVSTSDQLHTQLRSFSPNQVAYFHVVE